MRVIIGLATLSLAVGIGANEYVGWGILGFGVICHGIFCKPPVEFE